MSFVYKRAFSLVELSIVLVILGLLVGGVLSGQSLMRASELRNVLEQITSYTTAEQTFRSRYFYLPGDLPNATAFWGKNNALCPGNTGNAGSPGTCNGNGDGMIGDNNRSAAEAFIAWQHLANAGLISGTYTGVVGPDGTWDSIVGVNVPTSRIANVGFGFLSCVGWGTTCNGGVDYFPISQTTVLSVGKKVVTDMTQGAFMTQTEAWNIDTKVDDGRPGTGLYTSWKSNSAASLNSQDCATTSDPTTAVYKLSMDTISCSFEIGVP